MDMNHMSLIADKQPSRTRAHDHHQGAWWNCYPCNASHSYIGWGGADDGHHLPPECRGEPPWHWGLWRSAGIVLHAGKHQALQCVIWKNHQSAAFDVCTHASTVLSSSWLKAQTPANAHAWTKPVSIFWGLAAFNSSIQAQGIHTDLTMSYLLLISH